MLEKHSTGYFAMTELTVEEIDQLEVELSYTYPNSIVIPALCTAARASVCRDGLQGHKEPCAFCGEPCDGLTGNPTKWPLGFSHPDGTGVCRWHHTGCVTERLFPSPVATQGEEDDWVLPAEQRTARAREYEASVPPSPVATQGECKHPWMNSEGICCTCGKEAPRSKTANQDELAKRLKRIRPHQREEPVHDPACALRTSLLPPGKRVCDCGADEKAFLEVNPPSPVATQGEELSELMDDAYAPGGPMSGKPKPAPANQDELVKRLQERATAFDIGTCTMFYPEDAELDREAAEAITTLQAELDALRGAPDIKTDRANERSEIWRKHSFNLEGDVRTLRTQLDEMKHENEFLLEELERHAQTFSVESLKVARERDEARQDKERLREALEKIAKPALGGKTQQGIARAALASLAQASKEGE